MPITQVETILMLLNGYELASQRVKLKSPNLVNKCKKKHILFIWEKFALIRFYYN